MPFMNETDAITYVFESIAASNWRHRGLDEHTRDVTPTRRLLDRLGLPAREREYVVITGSKGKGTTAAITAQALRTLGYCTGLVTSPHLTTYRQRFRIDGHMISEGDLVRLVNQLRPAIDAIRAELPEGAYLSPQGIFLAMALTWFDEQGVEAAVIEVGRGGRFDDNALVPNHVSLFTPMMLEHTRYLGSTLDRIAWHKAGIIKPRGVAISLPQEPIVVEALQAEAATQGAALTVLDDAETGHLLHVDGNGQRIRLDGYGEMTLALLGRYTRADAALALRGAEALHVRLGGTADFKRAAAEALQTVTWPGRCQRLASDPAVYVDGAINPVSAASYLESVWPFVTRPVISVLAVPTDRDVPGVYSTFAPLSDALIITSTGRNVTISFPGAEAALPQGRRFHSDVTYAPTVAEAIQAAVQRAGEDGTVLLSLAQPAIGDAMAYYGLTFEQI